MKIFQIFLFCLILPLYLHASSILRIDIGAKNTTLLWVGDGHREVHCLSNQKSFDETIHGLFLQFMPEGGEILLYAHSMLGDAPGYSDYAEWVVQKHFQEDKLLMIVEWGGWNPLYHAQLQLARDKAPVLTHILDAIEPAYTIDIISHSMGSDLIRLALGSISKPMIQSWVLLAPDIALEDFTSSLPGLKSQIKRIVIFTSRQDPFLTISQKLRQQDVLTLEDSDYLDILFYETESFGCMRMTHAAWLVCSKLRNAIQQEITWFNE